MGFLRRGEISALALPLLFAGCATSFYRITSHDHLRYELSVSPDRVILQCQDVSENREIPYGFMIHILDEANTVVEVTQMNTLSREGCSDRLEKIGQILKTGRRIYVAGIGGLDDPKIVEKWTFTFAKHGTFHSNGRVLQFMTIANENGLCYDAYHADDKPCPDGVNFPIREKRYPN